MTPAEQAARETWRGVMEIHYRHQRSDEKSNTAKWNLSAGEGWQIIAAAIAQARREGIELAALEFERGRLSGISEEREACTQIAQAENDPSKDSNGTWSEAAYVIQQRIRARTQEG